VIVHIDADAEAELASAFGWYVERGSPGVGERFLDSVDYAMARIAEAPGSFVTLLEEGDVVVRRVLVRDFPYQVVFGECATARGRELWVFAVAHLHREPGYWRKRAAEPR
jgi:hypothetical protein